MRINSIRVFNHPTLGKVFMDLKGKNTLMLDTDRSITNKADAFEDITDLFFFLLLLPHGRDEVMMKRFFKDDATSFTIDFTMNKTNYLYYFKISQEGVHLEELYVDSFISYQNPDLQDFVSLPNGIGEFFSSLVMVDFNREGHLDELFKEAVTKCLNDNFFVTACETFLDKLGMSSINLEVFEGELYNANIPSTKFNKTLKTNLALLMVALTSFMGSGVVFLATGSVPVSLLSKVKLIKLFKVPTINVENSQILFLNEDGNNEYLSILEKDEVCTLKKSESFLTFNN